MATFAVTPLTEATWPDFARLVERHNGVWGGCWCMSFHPEGIGRDKSPAQNRAEKEGRGPRRPGPRRSRFHGRRRRRRRPSRRSHDQDRDHDHDH